MSSMKMSSKKPMSSMKMSSKKPKSSMKLSSKKPMSSKTHLMTKTRTPTTPSSGIDIIEITEKATKELKGEGVGVFVIFDTQESEIKALIALIPTSSNGVTFKDIVLETTTNKGAGRTSVTISAILAAKEQLDTFVNAVKNTDPNIFLSPQGEIAVSAKGLSVAVAFVDIDINDPKVKEKAKALLCIVDVCIVNLRVVTTSFFFRQTTKTEATATQKADETTVKNALQ